VVAANPATQGCPDYGKRPLAMNGKTRFQETPGAPGGVAIMTAKAWPVQSSPGGAGRPEDGENFMVIISQELRGGESKNIKLLTRQRPIREGSRLFPLRYELLVCWNATCGATGNSFS
jgi:hypothetical protein